MNFSKETTLILFRIILPLLIATIQVLLYRGMVRWFREQHPSRAGLRYVATVPFVLFNLALVYVIIFRPRTIDMPHWFVIAGAYPFFVWHGATLFIGLIIFLSKVLMIPLRGALAIVRQFRGGRKRIVSLKASPGYRQFDASRRVFLRRSVYGLTALSFAGNAYGVIQEKSGVTVTGAEFTIPGLPLSLDGFTITLVSDIHSSIFMTESDMQRYVELINGLNNDLIVVPGDFVTGQVEEVYPFVSAFGNLRARHGVFGVTGNHEYYTGDPEKVIREVDRCGIRILRNENITIQANGGSFQLLGVDDTGTSRLAAEKIAIATRGTSPDLPRVLLCHRPYFLSQAAEKDIQLVLSGHTHGGQIVLGHVGEMYLAPASLASRYVWGRYHVGKTEMYVSRGLGTVGLPIRINCPPEITTITLRART